MSKSKCTSVRMVCWQGS